VNPRRGLHGAAYCHPAHFEAQRERVLARGWHVVGDAALFEDPSVTATPCALVDTPLLLTREDGAVRALSNVCTHRGALLCDAPCSTSTIRCPYHGRRFRLDGSVAAAPGFDEIPESEPLPGVALSTLGPLYFASLAPPLSLDAMLEPAMARLPRLPLDAMRPDPSASRAFDVEGHWLLWCENYLEGFHIPYVHPRLARALELDAYEIETFEHCALQIGEAAKDEPCFEHEGRRVAGFYVFLYPWGLSLNSVRPLGLGRTRVEYRAYVLDAALRDRGAGADLDRVELEDDAIVARAQRGVASPLYRPGRLSERHERALVWFHARLAQDLGR
jgi:choline monooxygenase